MDASPVVTHQTHNPLPKYGSSPSSRSSSRLQASSSGSSADKPNRSPTKMLLVLADFTNTTGDPVFDGTLRQGLTVQLEQSPFLNLVTEQRIRQVLRMMGQPADAQLTPAIAREVCERTAGAAVLEGSIASLGSQYVLGLRAVDCRNGQGARHGTGAGNEKRRRTEYPE